MIKIFRSLQYTALITLSIAMLSCTKESIPPPAPPTPPTPPTPALHEDEAINKKMDAFLKEYYLWNDDYIKLTPNYAQTYNIFLSSQLMAMTTNIYDKKLYGNGNYQLYSYIERLEPVKKASPATGGVNHGILKKERISCGIVSTLTVQFLKNGKPTENIGLAVKAVYPNSPADKAGIKRGFMITEINGVTLTMQNYSDYAYKLIAPTTEGIKFVLTEYGQNTPTKEVTTESIYPNPVLMAKVFTNGGTKIGYLVYKSFDAAYDNELLAAIKTLKDAGVNEMILDLRLNQGGHVISSNMLSSCIAGEACNNKVFQYYTYNKRRMANPEQTSKETGNPFDSNKNKFIELFSYGKSYHGVDLHSYALNMKRLYIVTSGNTASASEAVINSLKGIGVPVELIGKKTNGKNVGMEVILLQDSRYNYEFAPITFEHYNAEEKAVNYLGITPDYTVDDWTGSDYGDFGTTDDPCFAKAYQLITGIIPNMTKTVHKVINATPIEKQLPTNHFEREGMIMLPLHKFSLKNPIDGLEI